MWSNIPAVRRFPVCSTARGRGAWGALARRGFHQRNTEPCPGGLRVQARGWVWRALGPRPKFRANPGQEQPLPHGGLSPAAGAGPVRASPRGALWGFPESREDSPCSQTPVTWPRAPPRSPLKLRPALHAPHVRTLIHTPAHAHSHFLAHAASPTMHFWAVLNNSPSNTPGSGPRAPPPSPEHSQDGSFP